MKTSGLSLAKRLSLSFAAVISLMVLLAMLASIRIEGLNGATELIVNDRYPKTHIANEVKSQINVISNSMLNVIIMGDEGQIKGEIDKIEQVSAAADVAIADLDKILTDAKGRELLAEIVKIRDKFRPLRESFVKLINDGNKEEAQVKYLFSIRNLQKKYFAALDAFVNYQDSQMKAAGENSAEVAKSAKQWILLLSLAAVALGTISAWLSTRSVIGPITAMQGTMTEIATSQDFSRRVPVERMDEVGRSIVAFNAMIEKIQESSSQLKQKTADIQAMMQYIPQGILTIQAANKVHPEYSAYLESILETKDIAARDIMDLIFSNSQCNAEIQSQVEAAISASIGEDAMNFEFNEHLLVSEVEKKMSDGRIKILDLSWSPITDDKDSVVRVMLCVRDITEIKQLAAEAGAQKRELEIIGQILAINQEKFHEFVDSSAKFLAENKQIISDVGDDAGRGRDPEVITELFRNMHTIKGNARTYGLLHLTNMVHEAEQTYDHLRKDPDAVWDQEQLLGQLASAVEAIEEYARINEAKLGRKGPGRRGGVDKFLMVQIDHIQQAMGTLDHVDWTNVASVRDSVRQVHNTLSLIGTEPIGSVLVGVTDSLPSLAKELGKEAPHSTIKDHGIVIKNQVADLVRNVFMHLYRNSMDHGIETPAERLAKGKPAAGTIELELSINDGKLQFKLRDDGRGLAVDFIRKKAIEKGLVTPEQQLSPEQTAQLIFLPGFSTAETVTEVSGRGVGMDAVKSFVTREQGTIELRFADSGVGGSSDGYRPFETVITLPARFAVQDEEYLQVNG